MKTKQWHQITLRLPSSFHDIVVGHLSHMGFSGFVEHETALECYIPAKKTRTEICSSIDSALKKIKAEFPEFEWSLTFRSIKEENWNKKWEEKTGIVEATPRILIKPSWKKLRKRDKGKIVLHIDPKMAFGTGHHETTRLTLAMIERYAFPDVSVLDFGCGTGVLAIVCAKLGASSVVAIDNDPWAVENATENIKRNRVEKSVTVKLGSVSKIPRRSFSLIVANIDVPTIKKFLPTLVRHMKLGGIVIFSGILTVDGESLIPLFARYRLSAIDLITENEWLAIALRKL